MPSAAARPAAESRSRADAQLLARSSPAGMAHVCSRGRWTPYEHLILLNDYLLRVAAGEIDRLMIWTPPRHGKSVLVSQWLPAWYLGTFPDREVMLASYEATLARSWGRKAREAVQEHGKWVFDIGVRLEPRAADWWQVAGHDGVMVTAGVGGALTGKGADCLPGDTLVSTEVGPVRLDVLARMPVRPRVRVLSRDEGRYADVIAARETVTDELYEITTDTGHRVRATGRHRFFVLGRGYVAAEDLRRGDGLTVTAQQDVREVRQADQSGTPLQAVLRSDAQRRRDGDVRPVWQRDHEESVRAAEGSQTRPHGRVLRSGVLPSGPRDQESAALRNLRGAVPEEDDAVLLASVPASESAGRAQDLPPVRRGVPAAQLAADVLLTHVREPGALRADARRGELAFQDRDELRRVVPADAPADSRSRRARVLALPRPRRDDHGDPAGLEAAPGSDNAHDPSHRRGPAQQPGGEPRDALPLLPHDPSQGATATIVAIERVRTERLPVYDLQVAGPSNFFADGVLVHNCLIIDDPIKNAEQAASSVMRDKQLDWWQSTASTRLHPGGAVVIVQTRWHEADLSGRLLQEDPGRWTVVNLPALAEEGDPLGRAPGAALCPELYDEVALGQIRQQVGGYYWSSMYQGRPAPPEGFLFKRKDFRYWRHEEGVSGGNVPVGTFILPDDDGARHADPGTTTRFQTVDTAMSEKETADWTVVATWGLTDQKDLLLLDLERRHFEEQQTIEFLAACNDKHNRPPMWIERFGAGRNPLQILQRQGRPVREIPVEAGTQSDKLTRAFGAVALCERHKLFLPSGQPEWLGAYEDELASFPNAAHDDMVDVTSYAARLVPIIVGQPARRRGDPTVVPLSAGIRDERF